MNTNERLDKKTKCLTVGIAVMLVTAFVLVQPTLQTAYAVDVQNIGYDDCERDDEEDGTGDQPEDGISMDSVIKGNIVKTIHVEKEKFSCFLIQGNLPVAVDVDTYIELWENINTTQVIKASAFVVTCVKAANIADVIGCKTYVPSVSPVPVGSNCSEDPIGDADQMENPQEMNTVRKGDTVKTIVAQKEVFDCDLNDDDTDKKVDLVVFTEIYESVSDRAVTDIQTHAMRCVILETNDDNNDDPDDETEDARVESCVFKTVFLDVEE